MRKRPAKFDPKEPSKFANFADPDQIALNRLMDIREKYGDEAFQREWRALIEHDLQCASQIALTHFPADLVNAIRDQMAEAGMTLNDLKDGEIKDLLKKTPERPKH
jgi:hypothetical protein